MGEAIDIGEVRVGDRVRVANLGETHEDVVARIEDGDDGFRAVIVGERVFTGQPGQATPYNRFVLLERPKAKAARALAELAAFKTQIPHDILRREIAPMLGLTKKGGRRGRKTRRKTRKSRK